MLLRRELDVAHPQAHRRLRHADTERDVFDRRAFLAAQLSCEVAFACFHIGKLQMRSDEAGGEDRTPVSRVETSRFATKLRPRDRDSVAPWIRIRGLCTGRFSPQS